MYTPGSYRESDTTVLHGLMRRHSFATVITAADAGLVATHLPFMLDGGRGTYGTLIGHMARANRHWRAFDGERESLVAFLGPHSYVSPTWYVRPDDVPTWNYAAVHAYGAPRIVEDPEVVRTQVLLLTAQHEAEQEPRWDPRHVEHEMSTHLRALVGFEIPIRRLEGTYKFSQNRCPEDRSGVVAALEHSDDPLVREVATIMRRGADEESPS